MAQRAGYTEKQPNGTITHYIETSEGSGQFAVFNAPAGFSPTRSRVAIPKPVDKTWPTTPGQLDLDKYGDIAPLLNGFRYTDFFRLANEPVSRQLKQQDLVAFLSLTESERSDMSIRSKVYAEIGGSQLNHPQLGDLQHHAQFVTAGTQNLVEALHANFDGRYAGVNRVGFNFESTYMPAYDKWSVVLEKFGPNAANISWLCEWGPVKGQTRTLLQLWNGNLFQGEIAQRMVNRHVALVMYTKARCGNTTKVANSDGSVVYYVGLSQNDDSFNERDNLTAGASLEAYFWDYTANFDPFTLEPNGVNLSFSHQNKKLWDVQDWMNIYKYTNTGVLDPADFDALNGAAQNYPLLWSKVKPSQEWVDLNIPVWFDINQRKLAQVGRGGIPVSYQFHYRYEEGIQRGDDYDTKSKAFGLDEAVCPPWFNFQIAVLGIMSAKNPESGITNWSTVKRYPDSIWDNNINATRPQGDRISVRAAKLQMAKFREYFNPANNPVILYRNFLRYPVSGGAYGASAVDGGNGFYRRTPKDIGSAGNPSDRRTKASVLVRVIEKNGAKWALIVATNQRLNRADPMTLDLRLRPAEVPGLSGIVDVTGISLAGFEDTFVREVCLEPEKLGTVAAGTGTTTTPVITPVAASEIPFEPVAANMDAWGPADMFYLENAQIKVGLRKSVGGCVCHMSSKADGIGLINDVQITHNGILESDKGRQLQFVSNYGTPVFSFFQNVGDTNDFTTNDTGNNPVQGGNRATAPDLQGVWNKPSPMLACEVRDSVAGRGRVLYYKVNPYHWSLPSTAGPSELIGEVWVWLDGPALRFVVRVTNNRTDTQRIYEGREQEMPCLYATAGYYRHFVYQGNAPFTGGALTEVTLPNPALITEGHKEEHGQPRYASENFMMALEGTATKGITLWLPKNSRFMNKQFGSRVGGETDNESSYIAGGPVMDFDNNCVYVYSGAAVVGEKDFMRNWVTSQTRIAAGFEFNFGYTNDFWASVNGDMRLSNGVLTMNFGKANNDGARREGVFFSPPRVWSAADLRTIYITGAFKGVSRMAFCVTGSKVDDGNVDGKYGFNVIGDGVERTYIVDLSAVTMPATVCRVGICHHPDTVNSEIGAEAWLKPKRIANTAPGTTAPTGTTTPVSTITRVGHHYDSNTDAAEIAIQRTDSREYKAAIYPVGTAETAIVWRSMTAGSWTYSGMSFNLQTATILNIPAGTYQLSVQPDGVPSERVTRTVTYGNTNVDGQLN